MTKRSILSYLAAFSGGALLSVAPIYGSENVQKNEKIPNFSPAHAHPHHLPDDVQYPPRVRHLLHENSTYAMLYNALSVEVHNLTVLFSNIIDQTTYQTFYDACVNLANSVSPVGRLVFAESDGTVVVDTGKGTNSYANWQSKSINENHNTRASFILANIYPAGIAVETKFSSSSGTTEAYVAIRGQTKHKHAKHPSKTFLNEKALGVFRLSVNVGGPI